MAFEEKKRSPSPGGRLETLDLLRGITLISMILYHWMWDFIYLSDTGSRMAGLKDWYTGPGGFCWQQSICWTFILLSGFCVPFSRRIFRRGLQVTAGGLVVSAVTLLWMYDERVLCGVLSFLGAAMLLTGALGRLLGRDGEKHAPADRVSIICFAVCCILFYVTRWVNRGFLQLWPGGRLTLPSMLYTDGIPGAILTAVGFPMKGFFSTDYFSLIPWIFLFWAGMFLNRILRDKGCFSHQAFHISVPILNDIGKHSLPIYLLHQPVIYLITVLLF